MTCWLCGFETTELATNAKAPACEDGPQACQICIAVANVDEEINQAVAALQRLLAKRSDLRSEQNRVHGALIHRLPTEIMHHIFELLSPTRTEWGGIIGIQPPAIQLYTSVCRNWRDLAWSNPFLWSTIQITLGRRAPPSDTPNPTNFVRDWVLRSQTLPLTFHIVEKGCSELDLKVIISQCSNRCRSLSLDVFSVDLLQAFNHSNFQGHLLRSLRIHATGGWQRVTNRPVLSNLTIRPEKIEIRGVPFQSLQISWNYLTSAEVATFDLKDLAQLFQHASQMTWCHIVFETYRNDQVSIPPIVHHNLKTLIFNSGRHGRKAQEFLGYLTLPRLQQVEANETFLLNHLPALVHRSSCPLTRIILRLRSHTSAGEYGVFDDLQPLPGMTDLVVESLGDQNQSLSIQRLFLEEYFPDLRLLTLRLQTFYALWANGVIPLFLDRNRPRLGIATKGRQRKIVVENLRTDFDTMAWDSEFGKELKALELDINLTEKGFEILIPED
jgi:hypothetical protein